MKTLVIVESPAKAKTIAKFLGKNFIVKSSFGHVRDLPKSKLGIDIENNFTPQYQVSRDKSKIVKELKTAATKIDDVLFATDQDREGEAISWHLAFILNIDETKAKRITFHEITRNAILEAVKSPRLIDIKLVDAQQARRVLDRLVGYQLSPFLWRKVSKGLSAGRVQSVAVRLVVEREREIQNFKAEEYWTLEGIFADKDSRKKFNGKLHSINGEKLGKMDLKNKEQVDKIIADLKNATYSVALAEDKATQRLPLAPFTTSTLQQEANHNLGYSAKQTMRLAQQLYEGVELGGDSVGLITYMRTDSVNLSEKFLIEAKQVINDQYGADYVASTTRQYTTKSKNAQEAHEAIRPTEVFRTPDSVQPFLDKKQLKLYELIWRRAVASQMAEAKLNNVTLDVISNNQHTFRATGQRVVFDGFLKLFPEKNKEHILPKMNVGDKVKCLEFNPEQHSTEPPARYSDATLVKILEEYGIGRPSTYAPTLATIEGRGYVGRDEKKRLQPKDIAFLVNDLLVQHFPKIVDYQFTAQMEEDLDQIALGNKQWQPVIADFYYPFKENLEQKDKELTKKDIVQEETDIICEKCGAPMINKFSRYGKFLACSAFPNCKNTKSLDKDGNPEIEEGEPITEKCEKCGEAMVKKIGRFGAFLACSGYPKCKNIKNIDIKIDMACPKCLNGDVVERRSRRGKIFYGCNRYPKCDFALWNKPAGKTCKICQSQMIYDKKNQIICSNKECSSQK
ncbi:MAG: type I DNA topoisomerase [Candidatus Magasanikbacteria bacterium CG10_big_fil_rev_8_21_14_0_10_36_32]|uniref:DNA topoisomerase 1 n=1 Tax=Candidatus Magasanikbacteria bacterium CG10_big_fil_rev_8_21_14_0_10_36_32 TaxID=1974646 RepID=A0A2M6W6M7_9BACT|nr:MAG: type I DNA topoisomerase [Candidatus Magasanikbacteria bacterium CG10_big_fil_rev_8_21_14_0_10_36_32]